MSKKQTEAVLGDLVSLVTKHLKKGDRIRIGGLGILQVRKRAAREGRTREDLRAGIKVQKVACPGAPFRPRACHLQDAESADADAVALLEMLGSPD